MIKYGVNNIVEFVWGDDFLCYALSGVILEVVADGSQTWLLQIAAKTE